MAAWGPGCGICYSNDCPGCDQGPEEPVISVCKTCGLDFEVTEGMPDGADFCGSYNCRVAMGMWPGASEADRAIEWRCIFRAAVARERRAFSPTNIRSIIRDCKAELGQQLSEPIKAKAARETAAWYERLYLTEDRPARSIQHAA